MSYGFNISSSIITYSGSLSFGTGSSITGSLLGTASHATTVPLESSYNISLMGDNNLKIASTASLAADLDGLQQMYYDFDTNEMKFTAPDFTVGVFDNGVSRALYLPNGHVLAVGDFTSYDGTAVNYITVINQAGNVDTSSFNYGAGLSTAFNSTEVLFLDSNNKVILPGRSRTSYSGSTVPAGPIRLNTDGTWDTTFNTGTGLTGADARVTGIAETTDGYVFSILAAGTYNGTAVNRIFKVGFDGTLDTTFNSNIAALVSPGGYFNTNTEIRQLPDKKIIAYDVHPTVNYTSGNNIIVLNSDGTEDTTFTTNAGNNVTGRLVDVIIKGTSTNYDILFLGQTNVTTWNTASVSNNFRINQDGVLDSTFTSFATNNSAYAGFYADNNYYFGGIFTTTSGSSRNRIASVDNTGLLNTTFDPGTGFDNAVNDLIKYPGANLMLSVGTFTTYKGVSEPRMILLDFEGNKSTGVNTSFVPSSWTGSAASTFSGTASYADTASFVNGGVSGVFNTTGSFNITVVNGIITAIV